MHEKERNKTGNGALEDVEGGAFGELMGGLAPAELLKRPTLAEFAKYVAQTEMDVVVKLRGEQNRQNAELTRATHELDKSQTAHEQVLLSILYRAAGAGAEAVVRYLLDQCKLDVNGIGSGKKARTPLHSACANSQAQIAFLLLQRGASVNLADQHGVLPIHLAAQKGPVEVLEALLKSKTPLVARDTNQQTLLHHAARAGAPGKVLDALLEKWTQDKAVTGKGGKTNGSALEWKDQWHRTPLHWAVINGHRTAVMRLLEAGASVKAKDAAGETPLEMAERRARCGASDRPDGIRTSVFGDIAKLLGGSGATKQVSKYIPAP